MYVKYVKYVCKEGKKIIKRVRNLVIRDIKISESSKSKCQLTSQVVT